MFLAAEWPRPPWLGAGTMWLLLTCFCMQRVDLDMLAYTATKRVCLCAGGGWKGLVFLHKAFVAINRLCFTHPWLPVQLPGGKTMLVRRANTNYRRAQALGYDRRGSGELWPLDSRARCQVCSGHQGQHMLQTAEQPYCLL